VLLILTPQIITLFENTVPDDITKALTYTWRVVNMVTERDREKSVGSIV
jgi:hypothetical protein